MDKLKAVVARPGDDVVLMHAVERADELHTLEILAVKLGEHSLKLCAVQHRHERGLDYVALVVAEGDLITAQLLRLGV